MRVLAFVLVVAAVMLSASAGVRAQDTTAASAVIADASIPVPEHTVPARTMQKVKLLMSPAELKAIGDAAAQRLTAAKRKAVQKRAAAKAKAAKAAKNPAVASKKAVAAVQKAPKDELIQWVRANLIGETEASYVHIHQFLKGQMLNTIADLTALGADGVKALPVSDKLRFLFVELLVKHIGQSTKTDDQLMVPTPKLVKAAPPKKACNKKHPERDLVLGGGDDITPPREFVEVSAAPALVGDWLRHKFPKIKPVHMNRAIVALQRQTIGTFADLNRIGLDGIAKLLYVPIGIREALREAVIARIGTQDGYDDGKPVTAVRYVPPKPVKTDDCA